MPVKEVQETDIAVREVSEQEVEFEQGALEKTARQFISGLDDVTSFLARPLEETFGSIVFSDEGVEVVGPDEMAERREAGEIGLPGRAEGEPEGMFEHMARFGGQTAALGPGLGRAFGLVKPAQTVATTRFGRVLQAPRNMASQAGQTFAKSPVKSTLVETGLGTTAGGGGYLASQVFPDSDAAKFTGEIIGGIAPSLTPTGILIRSAGGVRNLIHAIRHPFTVVGGKKRASARAQRSLSDGEKKSALNEIEKETTIDPNTGKPVLTPAQRTGAPGMLSLERAVMESSEQLSRDADAQIARANEVIQNSLDAIGQAPEIQARATIEQSHKYLDELIDTRVRIAAQRVDERIDDLGPSVSREQSNLIAREEIENALSAARAQESELYALIPEDVPVPFAETKAVFDDFIRELGVAQQTDIPSIARQFLNSKSKLFFGKLSEAQELPEGMITLKDLRSLQGKLREVARNARSGDKRNLNMARIADDIATAISDDLIKINDPEISDAVSMAVNFSRNLHERFSKGTVGKILGKRVAGDAKVAPGLTLEQTIGVSGPRAREALYDLVKAFDSPESPGAGLLIKSTEDYLRSRFLSVAVERGALNTTLAKRFIKRNEELLSRLPSLKRQIDESIDAGDTLAIAQKNRKRIVLDDPRVSKATMLIQKGPVEAFRQISKLKPAEAAREAQKLVNSAAKDSTREAVEGLKSGFVEYLLSGARMSGKYSRDLNGRQFLSGYALRDLLNNQSTREMATRLLSAEEQTRLGVVVRDLIKLEKRLSVNVPKEGVIGDTPSKLVETVAGITGAAVGRHHARKMGIGGTVQIPGIMADRFRSLVSAGVKDPAGRLLRDAVSDETLFKELLEEPLLESGKKLSKPAIRRLNVWFYAVMAEHGGSEETGMTIYINGDRNSQ